ncbi:LacI family DNA-binding transcriptional regulator [Deinococcus oregonensis]|uniref:LacI family DNA-binding transcriptional regulator n=1 Tax=Deinococcus oregonensis TaxID=1805970 RepID=A0ABV6ATZ7_9DEIO
MKPAERGLTQVPAATIQDVARHAGVSSTTAKRALREPDKLSQSTLARVQAAVKALQYEPDQRAGSLRSGQNLAVGLIVGSLIDPFDAEFAHTTGRILAEAGYTLIISENEYNTANELTELQRLYSQRVAGIILRPENGQESRNYLRHLSSRGVHLLEFDSVPSGSPYPHVALDRVGAMREAVRHLHSLGHRHIVALDTSRLETPPEACVNGFPQTQTSLTIPSGCQRAPYLTEGAAYHLTRELMAQATPPTAIIALNGTQGIGAYRALGERGCRIPDDVSLITFDNAPWTSLVTPPITVMQRPVHDLAVAATRGMLALINGQTVDNQVFPAQLSLRQSTAQPRQNRGLTCSRDESCVGT